MRFAIWFDHDEFIVSVTFWVLALDHDLRLPKNVLGSVALKDAAGTKVALWDQISLDEGMVINI